MDITKASQILGVESKVLREFEVLDVYNPPNILKGYICLQSDNLYGALVIYSVNGLIPSNPQIIYTTPKLHYPFHMSAIGTRIYNWPKFNRVKCFEKWDGCLYYRSKILLDNYEYLKIGKIYKRMMKGEKFTILNYNFVKKEIEKDKIIGIVKKELIGNFVKIKCRGSYEHSHNFVLECTPNHKFWTTEGWVEAGTLKKGDIVFRFKLFDLQFELEEVIKGCILGDGRLFKQNKEGNPRFETGHSETQKEYLEFKFKLLSDIINSPIQTVQRKYSTLGFAGSKTFYRFRTKQTSALLKIYNTFYSNGKIKIPDKISFTPISLAFWYMDDGSLSGKRAFFHTEGFSKSDVEKLSLSLQEYGLQNSVCKSKNKYYEICLDVDSSEKLFSLISSYIIKIMQHKIPEKYRINVSCLEQRNFKIKHDIEGAVVLGISTGLKRKWQYDIETTNKNYFANGFLVHNTNVLSYSYRDFMGKRYCTFKTRLTPIVRCVDTDSVNFKVLWDEILVKYPELRAPEAVMSGEYAFSYEMYGYKNPIVVMYNEPIEASFIFAVKQSNDEIEPPEKFKHTKIVNKCLADAGSEKDLTKLYEAMREQAREKILVQDDGSIYGCEGAVLYVFAEEKWKMFKVKPDVIEQIHWAGDAIDYHSIVSTAKNALENISVDEMTTSFVVTLLKEEFSDIQIEKSRVKIEKAIKAVKDYAYFTAFVRGIYNNCPDVNKGDKGILMRYFSQYCQKKQMRPVYTALKEMGLVK